MLSIGSRGSAVVALQKKLGITADGIFGPATQAAVRNYQKAHGLSVDGVAGSQTLGKLGLSGGGGGSAPKGGGGAGAAPAGSDWSATDAGKAASFGWSLSVINSNPELKTIFSQATSQNWTTEHFVAKVRDTKWFKTHSDTFRQAAILQKADPATFNNNVAQSQATLGAMARQMGASLTASQLRAMATQAFEFGWNSDQMRQNLAGHVAADKSGRYSSEAATAQSQFQQLAAQYGIDVSPALMNSWVKASALGELNPDEVKTWAIQQASSRYPSLADRLKAGETVMDIASPYMQSYAQTLEVNPNSISLKDPLIQSALSGKDSQGKPSTKTVWQFENDLRNDPRYMKTQQAQDKVMAVGHQVLRDFGFMGN